MTPQPVCVDLRLAAEQGDVVCVEDIIEASRYRGQHSPAFYRLASIAFYRAVEQGHVECVNRLLPFTTSPHLLHKSLKTAAEKGHAACVTVLRDLCSSQKRSEALARAAGRGHKECVNVLIPGSDPTSALLEAARWGQEECLKLLIPISNPKANDSWALREAVKNGHAGCVRALLPVSTVHSNMVEWAAGKGHTDCVVALMPFLNAQELSAALCSAAGGGLIDCVQALIEVADLRLNNGQALYRALSNTQVNCARILFGVGDPSLALQWFRSPRSSGFALFEQLRAEHERAVLRQSLSGNTRVSQPRKI